MGRCNACNLNIDSWTSSSVRTKARHNTKLLVVYFVARRRAASSWRSISPSADLLRRPRSNRSHGDADAAHSSSGIRNSSSCAAVGTLAVIVIGSALQDRSSGQGRQRRRRMLGGRLVNPNTTDPDERKLLNVVEEMAIASGVPVPQVYVLDDEAGINAFAAGHSPSDAVVGVTRGCMKLLNRDELQGVIGHEFSHILNGDMRLNLRLMGIIFGILCLAVIGRILLYTRSRSSKDKNPLPLLGLVLIVIGWIGVFFGRLIQAAVSRQREFLADASSVQFTRNPRGFPARCKKSAAAGSQLESAHAGEASHMFFGNGMGKSFLGMLATHPPLEERIRAIDPGWDGKFTHVSATAVEAEAPSRRGSRHRHDFRFRRFP